MVLIGLWRRIDPTDFSFDDLAGMLHDIDREEFNGRLAPVVARCLRQRGWVSFHLGRGCPGPIRRATCIRCGQPCRSRV